MLYCSLLICILVLIVCNFDFQLIFHRCYNFNLICITIIVENIPPSYFTMNLSRFLRIGNNFLSTTKPTARKISKFPHRSSFIIPQKRTFYTVKVTQSDSFCFLLLLLFYYSFFFYLLQKCK